MFFSPAHARCFVTRAERLGPNALTHVLHYLAFPHCVPTGALSGRPEFHVLLASFDHLAKSASPLALDEEKRRLRISTSDLPCSVILNFLPDTTQDDLYAALEESEHIDVFIFSGHGRHEPGEPPVIDMSASSLDPDALVR